MKVDRYTVGTLTRNEFLGVLKIHNHFEKVLNELRSILIYVMIIFDFTLEALLDQGHVLIGVKICLQTSQTN